jgi:fluoride ion exporter CrcB/FEX
MIGYLWIGLGGALGRMGRAWLAITIARITGLQFPWGLSSSASSVRSLSASSAL